MATDNINYRSQYFPNVEVTRIRGRPEYASLYKLYKEIKANAASVPSTLGGGQHGHLGLCIPPVKYQRLSRTPFIKPADPGAQPAVIPNASWEQIQALRLVYNDNRREFEKLLLSKHHCCSK